MMRSETLRLEHVSEELKNMVEKSMDREIGARQLRILTVATLLLSACVPSTIDRLSKAKGDILEFRRLRLEPFI
jgi:hypothetical protein